ncbi:unnamed protein product [Linum trigynum]|uniref:Magnesium transporter n=1 Tax=Linum trigynum TaxID=586398 RepID=A0AAV2EHW5_9ROSI
MVVNLEFIGALVTAEEVLIFDPLKQEVLQFVDQLRLQLQPKAPLQIEEANHADRRDNEMHAAGDGHMPPVTEAADDDNEDMADLYLTRKWIQSQQSEALLGSVASNSITPAAKTQVPLLGSNESTSHATDITAEDVDDDIEDLEMLLEAYFMQLDGTRNKILSVREYIDDTEDYVNIQLDNQRNELIQAPTDHSVICNSSGNLDSMSVWDEYSCTLYDMHGIFGYVVGGSTAGCFLLFFVVLGYARWKKLLGS